MQHMPTFKSSRGRLLHRQSFQQKGLSLVEFLIAIGLGLMIVAALTLLIAQQSATQAEFEKSSRQIENGRYAMQILSEDVQLAGYYGEFSKVSEIASPATLPDPCSAVAADFDAALPFAVQGYDSPATTAGLISCIGAAHHKPGTDILVVRRVETETPVSVASAAAGVATQVYVQSGLTTGGIEFTRKVATGATTADFTLTDRKKVVSPVRKAVVRIYFVSPCSVSPCNSSSDGGNPIPTLKMVELGSTGMGAVTPLVEGIENMQIDYGFDSTGDGAPDGQFKSDALAVPDWATVMALRIHLLARNNERSPGYEDNKTYTLGYNSAASAQQVTAAVGETGFKRRVFSQMVRLVNPSSRLD